MARGPQRAKVAAPAAPPPEIIARAGGWGYDMPTVPLRRGGDAMRLAAEAVLAMLAAAFLAGAPGAAEAPPDPAAETRRLVATPVDVGPESISPEKLFADIQRQVPGLKIVIDPKMAAGGEDFKDGRIGFSARRIPASEALTLVLGDNYAWEALPGGVRICLKEGLRELSIVRYPAGRLVAQPLPAGRSYDANEARSNITELSAIVMRTVNSMSSSQVAAWSDEGGAAELRWAGSSMVVSQTREGQRRIAELLLGLSRGLGLEYAGPMPERRTEDPAVEEVRRLLARRIDLDFEWVSIEDALDHIRKSCPGVSFIVDPMQAEDGVRSKGRRLGAKAKGMPIKDALSCCLKPSFGWAARPGYVFISDLDHLPLELPAALYPVRDLLVLREKDGVAWSSQELIAAIQRNVSSCLDEETAKWSDEGGPASIEYYRGMLVITQTRRGHEEVDRLLRLLRSAADFAKAQSSRPRAAVPCFAFPEDPQLVATYEALETRMDVDFKDKPVMEVIAAVAERAPRLNVMVEYTARLPRRITLNRQGATRQAILDELAGEKAHCEARRGYVLIKGEAGKYTRVLLAAYPVGGISRTQSSDGSGDALERAIESAVNHAEDPEVASWTDEGGPGAIDYCAGVFLITQTPQAHRRINALLQELRFRGRAGGPLP